MKKYVKKFGVCLLLFSLAAGFTGCNKYIEYGLEKAAGAAGDVADKVTEYNDYVKEEEQKKVFSPEEVTLVRVIDGDTIIVNNSEAEVRVRLIGIDTPESVNPDESKNTIFGAFASEYTKSILSEGQTLYLEYDEEKEDKYGRTLAYVWLSSDINNHNLEDIEEYMLNGILLKDGYAKAKVYKPNERYATAFEEIEKTAEEAGRGLWKYE